MPSTIEIPAKGATPLSVITLATQAKADIEAAQTGTSTTGVNGTSIGAGGALTTGQVLRATSAASAGWGALNLAAAAAVTGQLPGANVETAVAGVSAGAISAANQTNLEALYAGRTQKKTLTVGHADLVAAATSQAINLDSALPDNARIESANVKLATPFSGGGANVVVVRIGSALDTDAILAAADVFTAAVDGQATGVSEGIAPHKHFATSTQFLATFVSDVNVADLDAGEVTIEVLFKVLP